MTDNRFESRPIFQEVNVQWVPAFQKAWGNEGYRVLASMPTGEEAGAEGMVVIASRRRGTTQNPDGRYGDYIGLSVDIDLL